MAAAHAAAAASPTHRASSQATSTPPYPSAARIADSSCFPQYTASLKCLESNQNKSKCQQQFDDYKECKKKEIELESSWKDRCVLEEDEQVLRQPTEAYARALEMGLDEPLILNDRAPFLEGGSA